MDSRRWTIAKEIFHSALELPPERRYVFVEQAAGGDVEVVAEVGHLLTADAAVDSEYLESPLVETLWGPPLQPGDLLCNRFRIERYLAGGGMGFVYEALDTELGVRLALKAIRPELSADSDALERFRREVRLARRITHPNICRTFDLERAVHPLLSSHGEPIDLLFLTMEFVDGQTLAAHIASGGPLPREKALPIARDLANALHAAHGLGIVHRDIKPANIILDTTRTPPRPVITDFGLARVDDLAAADNSRAQSPSHRPIGSPPYMAPEQVVGAATTPATDIYAFGLVLYEMLTGRRVFPSSDPLSGIRERLSHSGLPDSADRSVLIPSWLAAIDRCLSLEPKDRFVSALDVIKALETPENELVQAVSPKEHRGWLAGLRSLLPGSALRWTFPAIVLLTVSAFLLWLRLYKTEGDVKVTPGTLFYMTPVRNLTGEKSLDGMTNLLASGLAQSVQVNLLDRGRVQDILRQMKQPPDSAVNPAVAREVAMRTGAVRVAMETLSRTAKGYRLEVDLQQPDNVPTRYRKHWAHTWNWTEKTDVPNAAVGSETAWTAREVSAWLRSKVGESANDIARFDAPPEEATTTSWQALADFSEAERLFSQSKREEAASLLQSAIRHDPQFALAEAFEGDILANLGQTRTAYEMYQKALEGGSTGRLTLRERDRVLGIIAHDTWDELAAEAAYREYTLFYAHDYDGWFRRARPLLMLGRPQESLEALENAHRLDPSKPPAMVQLVRTELILGNDTAAEGWLHELERSSTRDWYLFALGPAQFARHDYAAAAESFSTMSLSQNSNLREAGYLLLESLFAEQGKYAEAAEIASRSIERDPGYSDEIMHRAALACRLRQAQPCVADIEEALKLDSGPRLLVYASEILGHLAASDAFTATLAHRELVSLRMRFAGQHYGLVSDIALHRLLGETYLAEKKPVEAVAEFRKAGTLDAPFTPREYLARALFAQAAQTAERPEAERLLQEARNLYGEIALHPMMIWHFPIPYLPGCYADATENWLLLEKKLGRPELEFHQASVDLTRLRHGDQKPAGFSQKLHK